MFIFCVKETNHENNFEPTSKSITKFKTLITDAAQLMKRLSKQSKYNFKYLNDLMFHESPFKT